MMSTRQNPHRCPDNGCVLLVPGTPRGAGTNGGCKCLNDPRGAERLRVRNGIQWLADRVTATDDTRGRLAAEVDEAHAALGAILPTMRAICEVLRCGAGGRQGVRMLDLFEDLGRRVQEAAANRPHVPTRAVLADDGDGPYIAIVRESDGRPVCMMSLRAWKAMTGRDWFDDAVEA